VASSRRLHDEVNRGLTWKWSPEQISARLVVAHPDDPEMRVSHETIYQTLYLQARGELRTELKLALRQGRAKRVNRSRASCSKGKIRDMVNISERPAEAEDRAVPGFWEGDLIIGKANASQVATLVERTTQVHDAGSYPLRPQRGSGCEAPRDEDGEVAGVHAKFGDLGSG
jgi:transposase, IS30 family